MSTLGDIATVVAPTVVALAAIGVSTWQQSRSRRFDRVERAKDRQHERRLSDLDYQRRLVDDVATALESANEAIIHVYYFVVIAIGGRSEDEVRAASTDLQDARGRLKVSGARMMLRFGPAHDAVEIIDRVVEAVDAVWSAAITYDFLSEDEKADSKAKVEEARANAADAMRAFLTVTGGVVGSAPERG